MVCLLWLLVNTPKNSEQFWKPLSLHSRRQLMSHRSQVERNAHGGVHQPQKDDTSHRHSPLQSRISPQSVSQSQSASQPNNLSLPQSVSSITTLPTTSSQNDEQISADHIIELLSILNSKCTETGGDCTSLETTTVDTTELDLSLKRYQDTPEFKEYQIAETIKSLAPLSVTKRWDKKNTVSGPHLSRHNSTEYYDVYGAEPRGAEHKKVTTIITGHVAGNADLVNIILEYRGNEIFLFTVKTKVEQLS